MLIGAAVDEFNNTMPSGTPRRTGSRAGGRLVDARDLTPGGRHDPCRPSRGKTAASPRRFLLPYQANPDGLGPVIGAMPNRPIACARGFRQIDG